MSKKVSLKLLSRVPGSHLRFHPRLCCLCALLISQFFVSHWSVAEEVDHIRFQLDWIPGGDKGPLYVGIEQGFFAEQNLEVDVLSGKGSTDAITRLATGASDIGASGFGALLSAKAQHNVPVSAIYSVFTKPPHAFVTTNTSGINSVSDLAGRKVSTSPFTSSNVFLPLVLAENGMSLDDIDLVKVDPGAMGPLLVSGRVDATIEWLTNAPRHMHALAQTGKTMVVIPWHDAGMKGYATSIIAGDRFLQEHPDLVRRFLIAYEKSLQFVHDNPGLASEAVHAQVSEIPIDTALRAIQVLNELSDNEISQRDGLGTFSSQLLTESWLWVAKSQGFDVDSFDPETAVNRSFLP